MPTMKMACFVAILILNSYIVGSVSCETSCFQLHGGALKTEGLLQANVNNAWKDVCYKDDLNERTVLRGVCQSIDRFVRRRYKLFR
ncbi:hypothetical protein MAR_020021 [Mya arenaria]|uniref:Uncharacterized protein n=1 Tax=Mya arenaria TaxID=6604 RepID=A0ABY7E6T0_MYAAR|nr:hypothetical protein MAR_020021 [Mya arenaria]